MAKGQVNVNFLKRKMDDLTGPQPVKMQNLNNKSQNALQKQIRHAGTQTFQCVLGKRVHGYFRSAHITRMDLLKRKALDINACFQKPDEDCPACRKAIEDASQQAKQRGALTYSLHSHVPCCSLQVPREFIPTINKPPLFCTFDDGEQAPLKPHPSVMNVSSTPLNSNNFRGPPPFKGGPSRSDQPLEKIGHANLAGNRDEATFGRGQQFRNQSFTR